MDNDQTIALVKLSEELIKSKGVIEYLERHNENLRRECAELKMKPITVED